MTVPQLLIIATLASIAIATLVAVEFNWMWGLFAYFVCAFVLDKVIISYAMKHLK